VSKERARRRAEREAESARAQASRARKAERRARRRALVRRLTPPDRRRAWLLTRRSPGQRAFVTGVALGAVGLVWYFVDGWPTRIGFTLLVLLLLPVFVIMVLDRRV
jgi:Flp pilus assembly protein TadB